MLVLGVAGEPLDFLRQARALEASFPSLHERRANGLRLVTPFTHQGSQCSLGALVQSRSDYP